MIQANELRIGNWFKESTRYFQVEEIKKTGVRSTYIRTDNKESPSSLFSLNDIDPIPLTPEMLEKAGFVCDWDTYRLDIKGSGVIDWSDDGSVGIGDIGDSRDRFLFAGNGPCKYVHQLQNLYWCLCGEELEINL